MNIHLHSLLRSITVLTAMFAALPLSAATIVVTPATFKSALAAERGGDTIKLVGVFGAETLTNRNFSGGVVIDATAASFTATLQLDNVSNLTMLGGAFDIRGAPDYTRAVRVFGGSNISMDGTTIAGSTYGEGIVFNGTAGVSVTNGNFGGLRAAVVVGGVTNGTVTNNSVTGSSSDGIDIADSHGVTASGNSCSNSAPSPGAHPDCIQLWSITDHPLQSNIVVSNNTATGATQGFTAFSTGGGSLDVEIVHNNVDTSYSQGVACYDCIDSNISYNDLATLPGSAHLTNLNVIGGSGNTVLDNVIGSYDGPEVRRSFAAAMLAPNSVAMFSPESSLDGDYSPPDLTTLLGAEVRDAGGADGLATVPEPSSWAMLIVGFASVGGICRQGRRSSEAAA